MCLFNQNERQLCPLPANQGFVVVQYIGQSPSAAAQFGCKQIATLNDFTAQLSLILTFLGHLQNMGRPLTEDEILAILAESSDVEDDEDEEFIYGEPDPTSEVPAEELELRPGTSAPPNILQLEQRDYEAVSQEDEGPADEFMGTMKKDIRWKISREPVQAETSEFIDQREEIAQPGDHYSYFEKYLDESFFSEVTHFTNQYATQTQELRKTQFKPCTSTEIKILFAQHIMMGIHKFPRLAMYHDRNLGMHFYNKMSLKRFSAIRTNLHMVDISTAQANQKLRLTFKIQPMVERIRRRLLELTLEEFLSIDEQMMPFKGNFAALQYVKGKPCPWGIKIFCLNGKSGQSYDFFIYEGATTPLDPAVVKNVGYGSAVVLKLVERIGPDAKGHKLFFDNYFPSYKLFEILKRKNIFAAATIRINRFANPTLADEKTLKKQGRGSSSECVSNDGNVIVTRWYDNKVVNMASNFVGIGEKDQTKRWDKATRTHQIFDRQQVIQLYNDNMGGVDLMDQLLQYYRISIRCRKWTLKAIMHFIDFAIVNSWIEYRRDCKRLKYAEKDIMDSMAFRAEVANTLNNVYIPTRG